VIAPSQESDFFLFKVEVLILLNNLLISNALMAMASPHVYDYASDEIALIITFQEMIPIFYVLALFSE
jgi:hypothetical protein